MYLNGKEIKAMVYEAAFQQIEASLGSREVLCDSEIMAEISGIVQLLRAIQESVKEREVKEAEE